MSKECKDEVVRDMNRMATDYRLNWRLNHACETDINKLCPSVCSSQPGQVRSTSFLKLMHCWLLHCWQKQQHVSAMPDIRIAVFVSADTRQIKTLS